MEQLFGKFAKLFYENTSVLQFAYWKVSWLQIAQRGKSFSKNGSILHIHQEIYRHSIRKIPKFHLIS